MKKVFLILAGLCLVVVLGWEWYGHVNAVPRLRELARRAVDQKLTKDQYRALLSQDHRIRIEATDIKSDKVVAEADEPFNPYSAFIISTVTFEDGVAKRSYETELGMAL
jgi:hypothetical protein